MAETQAEILLKSEFDDAGTQQAQAALKDFAAETAKLEGRDAEFASTVDQEAYEEAAEKLSEFEEQLDEVGKNAALTETAKDAEKTAQEVSKAVEAGKELDDAIQPPTALENYLSAARALNEELRPVEKGLKEASIATDELGKKGQEVGTVSKALGTTADTAEEARNRLLQIISALVELKEKGKLENELGMQFLKKDAEAALNMISRLPSELDEVGEAVGKLPEPTGRLGTAAEKLEDRFVAVLDKVRALRTEIEGLAASSGDLGMLAQATPEELGDGKKLEKVDIKPVGDPGFDKLAQDIPQAEGAMQSFATVKDALIQNFNNLTTAISTAASKFDGLVPAIKTASEEMASLTKQISNINFTPVTQEAKKAATTVSGTFGDATDALTRTRDGVKETSTVFGELAQSIAAVDDNGDYATVWMGMEEISEGAGELTDKVDTLKQKLASLGDTDLTPEKIEELQADIREVADAGGDLQGEIIDVIKEINILSDSTIPEQHAQELAEAKTMAAGYGTEVTALIKLLNELAAAQARVKAKPVKAETSKPQADPKELKNVNAELAKIVKLTSSANSELGKTSTKLEKVNEVSKKVGRSGPKAMQDTAKETKKVNRTLEDGAKATKEYENELRKMIDGMSFGEALEELKQLGLAYTEAKKKATNQVDQEHYRTLEKIVEGFRKKLLSTNEAMEDMQERTRKTDFLTKILKSSFNQLGFAMFVTTSTFRNLNDIARRFAALMQGGARWAEILTATSIAASRLGTNFDDVTESLDQMSAGYIKQTDLMNTYIELSNATNSELADSAPLIVKTATALAKLSGDTTKSTEILNELTSALKDGNAAAIDAAKGYIDLSNAQITLEIESVRLRRELTNLEKSQIIFAEFEEQSESIIAAADNIEGGMDNITRFTEGTTGAWNNFKANVAGTADELVGLAEKLLGTGGTVKLLEDAIWAGIPGMIHARAWIELLGASGDQLEETLKGMGEAAETAREKFGSFFAILPGGTSLLSGLAQIEALKLIDPNTEEDIANLTATIHKSIEPREFESFDFSAITDQLEWILGAERQFIMESDKLDEEYNDSKMQIMGEGYIAELALEREKNEKILEIRNDAIEQLAELEEDHQERLVEIRESYDKQVASIDANLALRESRMIEDAGLKKEDKTKKHKDKLIDIEDDYQKKLADINRKYELSRLGAIIDRDARALFQAQLTRREALKKAQEDADEKREDENDKFDEALKELDDNLALRLARLREDAQIRRDQAKAQWEEQRDDEKDNYEDQRKDAEDARDEAIKDEEKAWKKRRTKLKAEYKTRQFELHQQYKSNKQELEDSYDESLIITEAQEALQTFTRLDQLLIQADNLGQQLDVEKAIWREYWNYVNTRGHGEYEIPQTIPGGGGGGGGTDNDPDPGPGDPPPTDQDPCDDYNRNPDRHIETGFPCNPHENTGIMCMADGRRYICDPDTLKWVWHSGTSENKSISVDRPRYTITEPSGSTTSSIGGFAAAGVDSEEPTYTTGFAGVTASSKDALLAQVMQNGGQMPVTIRVVGDTTLEEIFNEIAYEAFIEITSEQ